MILYIGSQMYYQSDDANHYWLTIGLLHNNLYAKIDKYLSK